MNSDILKKSFENSRYEAFKKQEEISANRIWGLSENPKLPVYKKAEGIRMSVSWINLLKSSINNLRP